MKDTTVYLDDELEDLEPPYESPAHAEIGRVLDRYGIPFFYRHPTLVYEAGHHRIWHPDFSLPGYDGLVIEYAGGDSHRGQFSYLEHRRDVYAQNQIPAVFVDPPVMSKPGWGERLTERVAQVATYPGYGYCPPHTVSAGEPSPAARPSYAHPNGPYR